MVSSKDSLEARPDKYEARLSRENEKINIENCDICDVPFSGSLLYIDKDICVDTENGRCYKLTLHPPRIVNKHIDSVESIFFLLRRNNNKLAAFQYIKKLIRNKVEIKKLSEFFSISSSIYKTAAVEKKKMSLGKASKTENLSKKNVNETDSSRENGPALILQSEMMNYVFQPLCDELMFDSGYFSLCIQEYVRSLINEDIQIQHNFQMLIAKVFIRTQNYQKLQEYLQYHIIKDSMDIAFLLIGNVKVFNSGFLIAVDMLHRLKAFQKLSDLLFEHSFQFEGHKILENLNSLRPRSN